MFHISWTTLLGALMLLSQDTYVNSQCQWFDFLAFDLHRPSYPPFYQLTAVGTTTSRLKSSPISSTRCRSSLWISHCTPLQTKSSGAGLQVTGKISLWWCLVGCTSRRLLLKHSATFWRAVVEQLHSYRPVLPHLGRQIRFWRHLTWHAPDVLIRSQLVACIYFSRWHTPITV